MSNFTQIFEAKYLLIEWNDKDSALRIMESKDALPISPGEVTDFVVEGTTFSKLSEKQSGQIGFRIIDKSSTKLVYIKKPNGDQVFLKPILDNLTKKTWWVEADKWSRKNKRWQSAIFRTAGSVHLYIDGKTCHLKIGSSTFSFDQLTYYLKDFKKDLWYLALHETSYISAPVKEKTLKILDESSIKYFNQFISFADKILKNPKSELREIQELKKLKQVKPTPRTFMEIVTKGFSNELTSRAYKATYNVSENQYVLFIVNMIYKMLNNIGLVSNSFSSLLQDKIKDLEIRKNSYSDTIKINSKAVESDYDELLSNIEAENNLIALTLKNQNKNNLPSEFYEQTYEIRLGQKYNKQEKDKIVFFINWGLEELEPNDYYLIKFNNDWADIFKENKTYNLKGKFIFKKERRHNNYYFHILDFCYIDQLKILDPNLERVKEQLEFQINILKSNNWERLITNQERKVQNQEIKEINEVIKSASKKLDSTKRLSDKLRPTLNKIKKTQRKLSELSISPKSTFPDSMSFVQNLDYQGIHKIYKQIQSLSGLDSNVLKGLIEADEIGILNISLLYERWCLLQIIKVLIDKFGFVPEIDWKNKLLNQIIHIATDKVRNVSLKFENSKVYRKINLWYEKELTTNEGNTLRRPDFVLDLTSNYNQEEPKTARLILDAKFYENMDSRGGISTVIKELYNEKDYSQSSSNTVFILHPSLQSVPIVKTPQEWSENSYFGETKQFGWGEEFPNHRYGAIMLSPIQNKSKYLDNLQMCIGMFLQYSIENNKLKSNDYLIEGDSVNDVLNPIPTEMLFCLACGHDRFTYEFTPTKSKYGLKWIITCSSSSCMHKTYYNYCVNKECRNRIIKHGPYWSYHATQSMQPYNIKCPSCGEAVD